MPDDEVVTTTDEHFGLLGPLHASSARVVVVPPDADAIARRRDAEHAAPRALAGALDDRTGAPGARAPRADRDPDPRRRRPVGRARSRSTRAASTSSRSPGRSGSAAPSRRARSSSPTRRGCAWRARATSASRATNRTARSSPGRGRGASTRTGFPSRSCRACSRRSAHGRTGASSGRARRRERCRDLLIEAGHDVVTPAESATLVSWRPDGEETSAVVERLADAGVVVRDLPGTGLVRASVGWWTSEEDLERLVEAFVESEHVLRR